MAAPYTSQAISGYNSNPPADDGSAVSTNRITWAGNKTKLTDPIKTLAEGINSQLNTAFGKVIGGGGVTSISADYTIQATDQGKLVKATAALALTLADATTVTSPFVHAFSNISGSTITVSGSGGQTIDGNASVTIPSGSGAFLFTDGSNWFTAGLPGTLVGKQLMYGDIINGTLVQSNTSNAVTFALKTLAGADPSSTDPVLICFRNATAGTGNYVYRTVTAALSVVVSAGSTLGQNSNNTAVRVWVGLLDNAGTVELFVVNCLNGINIYPLGQFPLVTTTAEGGAGAADSAATPYSTSARTSKSYVILGYADYAAGLATAGNWNVNPTRIQLYGPGVPLPGQVVQIQQNASGAQANHATAVPYDDTIPQIGEGDQYMSQAITPSSAANLLRAEHRGVYTVNANANISVSVFNTTYDAANALASAIGTVPTSGYPQSFSIDYSTLSTTTSATTFLIRAGGDSGTMTFNGTGAARKLGGVLNSYLKVSEIMA